MATCRSKGTVEGSVGNSKASCWKRALKTALVDDSSRGSCTFRCSHILDLLHAYHDLDAISLHVLGDVDDAEQVMSLPNLLTAPKHSLFIKCRSKHGCRARRPYCVVSDQHMAAKLVAWDPKSFNGLEVSFIT